MKNQTKPQPRTELEQSRPDVACVHPAASPHEAERVPAAARCPGELAQGLWGAACCDTARESARCQSYTNLHAFLEHAAAERAAGSPDRGDSRNRKEEANAAFPSPSLSLIPQPRPPPGAEGPVFPSCQAKGQTANSFNFELNASLK